MKLIKYLETIEVPTNSTTKTKFYFGEQPNLRNKRIFYISAFSFGHIVKSPSNLTLVSNVVFNKSFLVLVSKNKEIINRVPLFQLTSKFQIINPIIFDLIIDFPKSYIEIGSIANLSTAETFLFVFYGNDQVKEAPEYKYLNIENLEVETTPATKQKFYFPDNENLRGKRIQFIDYVENISMLPSGGSVVNYNVRVKSYITLVEKGRELIRKIPIYSFMSYIHWGFKIPFDNIEIDFPNSYFEIPNTEDTVAGEKFFMNFYFFDKILGKRN